MAEQKGKFGKLIGNIKEQANQTASQPDNQPTRQPDEVEQTSPSTVPNVSQPDDQVTRQPDEVEPTLPSPTADAPRPDGQTAKQPKNQLTRQPDTQIASQPDEVKRVNLCVKVPEHWRKHWAIQARIQDTTMTEVMIEALTARFGLPDDQTTK